MFFSDNNQIYLYKMICLVSYVSYGCSNTLTPCQIEVCVPYYLQTQKVVDTHICEVKVDTLGIIKMRRRSAAKLDSMKFVRTDVEV